MNKSKIAAIIPARMASSRFPGKPLLQVRGLPMVEHVRRRALCCPLFSDVVVATCDREIAQVVESFGGRVIMTSLSHQAATDRVAEAVDHLDCTHIVNVQGDEILVLPDDLSRMATAMASAPEQLAWNALSPVAEFDELKDRSIVKCIISSSARIIFCARDFSSFVSSQAPFNPVRKILGILGYRRDFLKRYGDLSRTPWEVHESLDQSRMIEHDLPLMGVEFSAGYVGINEPREVVVVEQYLDKDPVQKKVLEKILGQ